MCMPITCQFALSVLVTELSYYTNLIEKAGCLVSEDTTMLLIYNITVESKLVRLKVTGDN